MLHVIEQLGQFRYCFAGEGVDVLGIETRARRARAGIAVIEQCKTMGKICFDQAGNSSQQQGNLRLRSIGGILFEACLGIAMPTADHKTNDQVGAGGDLGFLGLILGYCNT